MMSNSIFELISQSQLHQQSRKKIEQLALDSYIILL